MMLKWAHHYCYISNCRQCLQSRLGWLPWRMASAEHSSRVWCHSLCAWHHQQGIGPGQKRQGPSQLTRSPGLPTDWLQRCLICPDKAPVSKWGIKRICVERSAAGVAGWNWWYGGWWEGWILRWGPCSAARRWRVQGVGWGSTFLSVQVSPLLEIYEQFTWSAVRSLPQGGYVYSEFKFVILVWHFLSWLWVYGLLAWWHLRHHTCTCIVMFFCIWKFLN